LNVLFESMTMGEANVRCVEEVGVVKMSGRKRVQKMTQKVRKSQFSVIRSVDIKMICEKLNLHW
jgi:hypothetical protein